MTRKPQPPHAVIKAEITDLQQQLRHLNLPGKITLETRHAAETASYLAEHPNRLAIESERLTALTLTAAASHAHNVRVEAERETARLTREIDRLQALATAGERQAAAQAKVSEAEALHIKAQQAVTVALDIATEIGRQVATAAQALEAAQKSAGAALLSQIKAGSSGKLVPVPRDRLDALEAAQQAAEGELIDAQENAAQCAENLANARQDHAQVQADATGRDLYLLAREYAAAVHIHKTACAHARQHFDQPDVDQLVSQLEHGDSDSETLDEEVS